jgi:hypothetical protein
LHRNLNPVSRTSSSDPVEEIEANVERSFGMAAAAFLVGRDAAEEGSYDDCDNENEGEDDANDDENAVDDGNENNNNIVATSTCPECERKTAVCSFDTKTALSRTTRRSMAVLLWRMYLITISAGRRNCTDSALS